MRSVAGSLFDERKRLMQRLAFALLRRDPPSSLRKDVDGGMCAGAELIFVPAFAADRVPQAEPILRREFLGLIHRGSADAARRNIDDSVQG